MVGKDVDSLDQAETRGGTFSDAPSKSLGDASTFGDGAESLANDILGDDGFDDGMEVVDLSGRYEIEEVIGQGGMGQVLKAIDTRLKRPVAIKRVLGKLAGSRKALQRFLTEAQSVAALNHFNIVQIYDYGRDQDGPFLILEFVGGGSLLDRCRKEPVPLNEAVELTCQLCKALEIAHDAGIIHRDIKPANVLLTQTGEPKLTDFGLARLSTADTGMTSPGTVLGTPDYMAPEQRRDAAAADHRSDLWSLAATLYQLVTGKSPKVIHFKHVPTALQDVLGKALEEEQADRYQTSREFYDALRATVGELAKPISQSSFDLDAGECLNCHIKNESGRSFCRGCGSSLRASCLSCDAGLPVWEMFCGDCGASQQDLITARRGEMNQQREQAESLRKDYCFDEAIRIAEEIAAINDIRLQHLNGWSEEFATGTAQAKENQKQSAATSFAEAQTHHAAHDYPSAIRAIEAIPEAMLTPDMSAYLVLLRQKHNESDELIREISNRVRNRELDELLQPVERLLELRADRADIQKLKKQLIDIQAQRLEKRDAAYDEARSLLEQGHAKKAFARINTVKTKELRRSDVELSQRLEELVAAEDAFTALVKTSKAGGKMRPDSVITMIEAAESYLKLNPRHKKLAAIHQQLIDRIERSPRKYSGFPYVRKKSQGLKTVLGIDLGNTNSVVSVMDGSKAMVIPNLVGDRSTPSVVAFASDGEILVGEPARRQAVTNPLNTFDLIRQRLGRQGLDSCPIAQRKSHNPGENESGQVKRDDQQASAFRREYSPQEFCVNLLQNLKAAAESHLGYTVSRSVITVPSSFGLIQRRAMKEAGKIAGLDVLRIIAAPTAAALAYSFQFQKSPDRNIVVCDIGGGAFSTSVCSVFDTWVEVISTTGDAELGGVDFDMALVNSIAADFKSDSGIDIRTDPTSLWRLCDAVEKAKKSLSSVQVTDVNLPFITTSKLDAKHLQASVTRVEFERLIDPLLKRMKKCIENAMRDARMTNDEIDEVMLVGGGARIPKLRSEISEMFGVDKLYNGIEAEEAASVGAAIQGSIIAGEFADRCLMDVTSISLGVETEGGVMTSLVDRNFTIPTTKSEVFSTVRDNQTEVVVSVYEGERAMACDNSLLGRYKIDGIEPAPRGTPKVEVTFDIDVDGTLNVSAKNMANGNEFSVCPGEPSNPRQAELCSESDQVDIPDQLMVIDRDVVPDKTENSD